MKKCLILIYAHPEHFPPTVNAIINLSEIFDTVDIVYFPSKSDEWKWPANVQLFRLNQRLIDNRAYLKFNALKKLSIFSQFCFLSLKLALTNKYSIVLAYDSYALLALRIIKGFFKGKPLIWYHNHDVGIEYSKLSPLTLQYWVAKNEFNFFQNKEILFSLPTKKRLSYFELSRFKGHIFEIPNYPSIKVFLNKESRARSINGAIELVFFGSICRGRGLEDFIELLPLSVLGHQLRLRIFGFIGDERFFKELEQLIIDKNLEDSVLLSGPVSYQEIQKIATSSHIGLAYYLSESIMDQTISTASNKMFEYAALGLPVLTSPSNIGETTEVEIWQLPTPIEKSLIIDVIGKVILDYSNLSKKAISDFEEKYNFENSFAKVSAFINTRINDKEK